MWAYFDETIVYEKGKAKDGQTDVWIPTTLVVGGCFSSAAMWKDFETEWGNALASEGVSAFHAKDFYAFKREFEWYRDAEKDWPRHSAFRDKLTDIIIEYVDEATGFTSDIPLGAGGKGVLRRAHKDSVFQV
jgi:hypothetical protein